MIVVYPNNRILNKLFAFKFKKKETNFFLLQEIIYKHADKYSIILDKFYINMLVIFIKIKMDLNKKKIGNIVRNEQHFNRK